MGQPKPLVYRQALEGWRHATPRVRHAAATNSFVSRASVSRNSVPFFPRSLFQSMNRSTSHLPLAMLVKIIILQQKVVWRSTTLNRSRENPVQNPGWEACTYVGTFNVMICIVPGWLVNCSIFPNAQCILYMVTGGSAPGG